MDGTPVGRCRLITLLGRRGFSGAGVRGPEPRTGLATLMLVDQYLWLLHLDRRLSLDVDWGPLDIHLYGRCVFYMWVTVSILAIAGIAVLASRRRELIQKWTTWVLIALVVGLSFWMGEGTTAVLAAAMAVVGVIEFARLVKLRRVDTGLLVRLAVLYPLAAWLRPSLLAFAPIVVLACSVRSVLSGDVENGVRRTAVLGEVRQQHLQRDGAVDGGVVGAPHLAHPATAQQLDELVAAKRRALHRLTINQPA